MKHFPRRLISFRNLRGGQFGTLDVSAISPHAVQLALGNDFVCTTRDQWVALRNAIDRFFGTEPWVAPAETVNARRGTSLEQRDVEEGDEEVLEVPPPPPPRPGKAQRPRRGRTASI